MAGKFMNRNAVINTIKDQERTNAEQKRSGTQNHVTATICQCGDPDCGAFHTIDKDRPLPSNQKCEDILKAHNWRKKTKEMTREKQVPKGQLQKRQDR